MLRIILSAILIGVMFCEMVEAADKLGVAVMDLEQYNGAITKELASENLGRAVSEYIAQALQESGKFFVMGQDQRQEQIVEAGLQTSGIISPSMAKKIAAVLDVDYIIYGSLNGMSGDTMTIEVLSGGANVHTVRACLIIDMMNARTGRLIVARGEGTSKSSLVKAGTDEVVVTVGTKKITQVSVHNAYKKAAYAVVDDLIEQSADWLADNK